MGRPPDSGQGGGYHPTGDGATRNAINAQACLLKYKRGKRRTLAPPPKREVLTLIDAVQRAIAPWDMGQYPGLRRILAAAFGSPWDTVRSWRRGKRRMSQEPAIRAAAYVRSRIAVLEQVAVALETYAREWQPKRGVPMPKAGEGKDRRLVNPADTAGRPTKLARRSGKDKGL